MFTLCLSYMISKNVLHRFSWTSVLWLIFILGTSSRKRDERAKTVSQSCKTWYGCCGRYLHYNRISWLSNLSEWVQRKHHVKLAWNTVRICIWKIELVSSEWKLYAVLLLERSALKGRGKMRETSKMNSARIIMSKTIWPDINYIWLYWVQTDSFHLPN